MLFQNDPNGPINRVLTNSKFGLFYSNFLILTPTSKVPIAKYGKTPIFLANSIFTPILKILVRTLTKKINTYFVGFLFTNKKVIGIRKSEVGLG